ncbi:MAG TPA: hypothetical protein PLN46_09490 [Bacteroidales bacterium]|nr:hypothetical protein [Bacteroidales bacterium]
MKSNLMRKIMLLCAGAIIMLVSCEKDPDNGITAKNMKGMFVVCEGNFGSAEGDITWYNPEDGNTVKSLYYSTNGTELGDIAQSFIIADTLGLITVNNSQKVTVVSMKSFAMVKNLNNFSYPRGITRANEKTVYVANGNGSADNYIYSIDLTTLKKTDSLVVSKGPESLLTVGDKVYATISGGWNNDGNTVIEINPETFEITKTYTVGSCPVDLVADNNKNIWVYCKGVPDYSAYPDISYTGMGLCKIDRTTGNVTTFEFTEMVSPGIYNVAASPDGKTIYYLNDGVFAVASTATSLPASALIDGSFYGIDVDPKSGNLVGLDAVNSKAVVFNTNGIEQYSFETGNFPNSVIFSIE